MRFFYEEATKSSTSTDDELAVPLSAVKSLNELKAAELLEPDILEFVKI